MVPGSARTGRLLRRAGALLLLVAVPLFSAAVPLRSFSARHLALRASSPAENERLTTVPTAIRLEFTEPVEVAVSAVSLSDPAGEEGLRGPLALEDDGHVLTVPIEGRLVAGEYRVVWQAVGLDGHPVRGEFTFTIEAGAAGLAVTGGVDPDSARHGENEDTVGAAPVGEAGASDGQRPEVAGSRTSLSAPYTAIRWLMYIGTVVILGSLGLAIVVARIGAERFGADISAGLSRRAAGFGLAGALLLTIIIPLRLLAQSLVVFGGGAGMEGMSILLDTLWGKGWLVQASGCVLAAAGLLVARRGARWGWGVAALGALMLVISPGLSGHAAATGGPAGLPHVADALHVSGAGLWIGTLAAILFVGIPAARAIGDDRSGIVLAALVQGFSPLAMLSAGVLATTGLIAASYQLSSPTDLWTTSYGRVLTVKILVVMVVVALGAYNWRRMRPAMDQPGADRQLRRSGGIELAAAAVVILLTAILVAIQPPVHAADAAPAQPRSATQ